MEKLINIKEKTETIKFEDLLGKNVQEVMQNLKNKGVRSRIVAEDGEKYIISMDIDPNRYNFVVKQKKIISVRKG